MTPNDTPADALPLIDGTPSTSYGWPIRATSAPSPVNAVGVTGNRNGIPGLCFLNGTFRLPGDEMKFGA